MTAFPFSIQARASMDDARLMMKEHGVGHLPVKCEDETLSVISLRELERVKLPGHTHTDFDELAVGDLCPVDVYTVDLYTPLIEVLGYMAETHTDCALITRHEKLAGIFTFSDACRAYATHLRDEFFPAKGNDLA